MKSLLLCLMVMVCLSSGAASFLRSDGRFSVTNSTATIAYTVNNPITAGNTVAILVGAESGTIQPSNSIPAIDTRGNTYHHVAGVVDNSVHQFNIITAFITTTLQAGDTITLNWTNVSTTFKSAGEVEVFSGLANALPELAITNTSFSTNFTAKGTNLTAGAVLIGIVGDQANFYPTNFTWNQIGTNQSYAYVTNSTTGLCQGFGYLVTTAAGSNNFSGAYYETNCSCLSNASWAVTWVSLAPASRYYVDFASGVDSNDGLTTSTPWKHSPGDSNATSNAHSTVLTNATTIYMKGGSTYVGLIVASGMTGVTWDGNSDGTWGSGKALVDEGTNLYHFISAEHLIGPANGITINNFDVKGLKNTFNLLYPCNFVQGSSDVSPNTNLVQFLGNGSAYSLGGVFVYGKDWTIENCNFHESENWWYRSLATGNTTNSIACQQAGVEIYNGTNVTVTNCAFWGIGSDCIFAGNQSYNLTFVNNDMGGPSSVALTNRGWFAVAVEGGNGLTNVTFAHNKVHDGWQREGDDALQRDHAGDWVHLFGKTTDAPPNVTNDVLNVYVHHNTFYSDQAFNYANGSADSQIEEGCVNVWFYDNLVVNPHHFGVRLNDGVTTNIYLLNNTFVIYNTGISGAVNPVYSDGTNVNSMLLTNNIILTKANNSAALPLTEVFLATGSSLFTISSDYNLFNNPATLANGSVRLTNTDMSLTVWNTTTANDAHSLTNAMTFTSLPSDGSTSSSANLTLVSGSYGINAGFNLTGLGITDDYAGNARPATGPWDLGAYQYSSSPAPSIHAAIHP